MNNKIAYALEKSRQELLDIGLRGNSLLHFKPRVVSLNVVDEKSVELHKILVEGNKKMSFLPIPKKLEQKVDEDINLLPELFEEHLSVNRHTDTRLQTKLTKDQLDRKLLRINTDAETYFQEQGIDILYIALGFLSWFEDKNSDIERRAPLVLIPVSLVRGSAQERYKVEYTKVDLGTNLTLGAKLKTDFLIDLPEFNEDVGVKEYFKQVKKVIKKQNRWSVLENEIHMGFFKFGKFQMYQDLDATKWPDDKQPAEHPILKSLFGEGFYNTSKNDEEIEINEDNITESLQKLDNFHFIADADSSQSEAIIKIKQGKNLVIQGPPGTGKSQTITNIISESLADNKKVLFVSEKMVALEVVKRRLDNCHLGDTVLELHSHKSNKKVVLDELGRTLALGTPSIEDRKIQTERYVELREKLDNYVEDIKKPIVNSEIDFVTAVGHYSKLNKEIKKHSLKSINIENFINWSQKDFIELKLLVNELVSYLEEYNSPIKNPFSLSKESNFSPSDKIKIEDILNDLQENLKTSISESETLFNALKIKRPKSIIKIQDLVSSYLILFNLGPKWWKIFSSKYRKAKFKIIDVLKKEKPSNQNYDKLIDNTVNLSLTEKTKKLHKNLETTIKKFDKLYKLLKFSNDTNNYEHLRNKNIELLVEETNIMIDQIDDIYSIARYNAIILKVHKKEIPIIANLSFDWNFEPELLEMLFKFSWYEALVNHAYKTRGAIKYFDRIGHENDIKEFSKLDESLSHFAQEQLTLKHYKNLPAINAPGEMALIRREINKKRKHLPIRQLLLKSGNAIQHIKPVFMMSPMSVATFLAQGVLNFDLVVFDEASQVKVVDALIPILRGKQIVVVGDSKQMPPSDFFSRTFENDEEEEETVTGDIESILSMFLAQGAPESMLKWHYRSRHDSLINVSNQEFYEGKLKVFPSSGTDSNAKGLKFNHIVDSHYERGLSRTNPIEARNVAEQVFKHAKNNADLTLGVVAFSTAQRDCLLLEIERLRRLDSSCENFFSRTNDEAFFVKNLENVQGDERDVIFISIGYGKTLNGNLPKNFGPVNKEGGQRRLNVLITRARLAMEVFCNFTADDLETKSTTPFGVRALKSFLKYAKDGELSSRHETGKETDSPFEDQVITAIRGLGYDVEPQVGSAGFFIDIAVRDPDFPGKYILAVECDGASYHSSASARDRDRLRQSVLEGMGWKFHRIWSTDWFRAPKKEIEKLDLSIKKAINDINADTFVKSKINKENKSNLITRKKKKKEEKITNFYSLTRGRFNVGPHYEILEMDKNNLAHIISKIVSTEGAMHLKDVSKRITDRMNISRVGSRIYTHMNIAAKYGSEMKYFYFENEFVYIDNSKDAQVRDRSKLASNLKNLNYVPKEEIQKALLMVITEAFSIKKEEAISESLNLMGYKKATEKSSNIIHTELLELIKNNIIKEEENLLSKF